MCICLYHTNERQDVLSSFEDCDTFQYESE